jgi:hypothetical protein
LLQDLQTAIGKVGGRLDGETGAAS